MKSKSFLMASLLLCGSVCQMNAKPANPTPRTVTQPDGSTITVQMHGDEFFHYTTTEDGEYITLGEDGYYHYSELDGYNRLVAGKQIVNSGENVQGESMSDKAAIASRLQEIYAEKYNRRMQNITDRKAPMRKAARKAVSDNNEVQGLIILAEFQDVRFKETSTQEVFDKLMNEEGNNYLGAIGSARDYFIDQSYGKFQPTFNVVGPVTLDNNMSYYGANDSYGNDQRPDEMIIEACKKASAQGLCNMADYDLDGDGWVDLVYVIYAGYAESSGAPANTIWPHAWYVYQGAGKTAIINGVQLDAYACSSELDGTSGSNIDGIGSFCHEYSHTLGLPDFYDTGYEGAFGMDSWSIMDVGCYAENGRIPIGYMSYEREFCGWMELTELTTPSTVSLPYIGENATAYKITSSNPDQYFTLETRRQSRWDIGLAAEGLMIVKIDYDQNSWDYNTVNNVKSRQRVQIMPADNILSSYSLSGDLFPYGGNNSFTSTSSPAMKIYNTTIQDKPVTNIAYDTNQGVVTFDFMGGNGSNNGLSAPVATSAGEITSDSFTAYWSPVAGATSYTLYVERVTETPQTIVLEEDFSLFSTSLSTNIAGTSQEKEIDAEYTHTPGWSGKYIFNNEGECKMGNSSNGGLLTTPAMDLSATGKYLVSFNCRKYRSQDTTGTVTLSMTGTETVTKEIDFSELLTDEMKTFTFEGSNGSTNCVFSISSNKRIYIDDITICSVNSAVQEEEDIRIIPDITETQYTVTNISEGEWSYKVKAVNESDESAYSNTITVNITSSGVRTAVAETAVIYSSNNSIVIEGVSDERAVIYNMQGAVVATIPVNGRTAYTPADGGMYIVRCGNSSKKVLVK